MIIHECKQNTDEWYKLRLGKLTASSAKTIATNGKGLETLCFNCASEILTQKHSEKPTTQAMENGHILEDRARFVFEAETGLSVFQVGFIEINEFVGFSPDGLILEENSLVEYKCPQDNTFTKYLYDLEIKDEYVWQMQMQMLLKKATKNYYAVFNPNFRKLIQIQEVFPDQSMQEQISVGLDSGIKKIKEILEIVNERMNICLN